MKPLVTPIVNLNGTCAADLIAHRTKACKAISEAIEAMREAFPHGRDYQTHRTAFASEAARDAWMERIHALHVMRDELMTDAVSIQRQGRE
jgi:hypothetical protein